MKLSQALKKKKKLITTADKFFKRFSSANSCQDGKPSPYSAEENYKQWRVTVEELCVLKAKIQIANAPILEKIYLLAELKNIVSKLKSVNCVSGLHEKSRGGFGVAAVDVNYTAWMSEVQRDDNVEDIEERIELIQSEIEAFNAITEIK
jgi:hypothetical protein